jgi:hypothetical protein
MYNVFLKFSTLISTWTYCNNHASPASTKNGKKRHLSSSGSKANKPYWQVYVRRWEINHSSCMGNLSSRPNSLSRKLMQIAEQQLGPVNRQPIVQAPLLLPFSLVLIQPIHCITNPLFSDSTWFSQHNILLTMSRKKWGLSPSPLNNERTARSHSDSPWTWL